MVAIKKMSAPPKNEKEGNPTLPRSIKITNIDNTRQIAVYTCVVIELIGNINSRVA